MRDRLSTRVDDLLKDVDRQADELNRRTAANQPYTRVARALQPSREQDQRSTLHQASAGQPRAAASDRRRAADTVPAGSQRCTAGRTGQRAWATTGLVARIGGRAVQPLALGRDVLLQLVQPRAGTGGSRPAGRRQCAANEHAAPGCLDAARRSRPATPDAAASAGPGTVPRSRPSASRGGPAPRGRRRPR